MREISWHRLEELLDRLANDPAFKQEILSDPLAALSDYALTTDDLYGFVARLAVITSGWSGLEARKNRAALFRELAALENRSDTRERDS